MKDPSHPSRGVQAERPPQDGLNVAGLGPSQPGSPPAWTCDVMMPDADQTAAAVERAGGSVLLPPMDVLDVGRMGIFADPTGAVIAVWEPRARKGADLVKPAFQEEWLGPDEAKRLLIEGKEANGFCWNEFQTRDVPGSCIAPCGGRVSPRTRWRPRQDSNLRRTV